MFLVPHFSGRGVNIKNMFDPSVCECQYKCKHTYHPNTYANVKMCIKTSLPTTQQPLFGGII